MFTSKLAQKSYNFAIFQENTTAVDNKIFATNMYKPTFSLYNIFLIGNHFCHFRAVKCVICHNYRLRLGRNWFWSKQKINTAEVWSLPKTKVLPEVWRFFVSRLGHVKKVPGFISPNSNIQWSRNLFFAGWWQGSRFSLLCPSFTGPLKSLHSFVRTSWNMDMKSVMTNNAFSSWRPAFPFKLLYQLYLYETSANVRWPTIPASSE